MEEQIYDQENMQEQEEQQHSLLPSLSSMTTTQVIATCIPAAGTVVAEIAMHGSFGALLAGGFITLVMARHTNDIMHYLVPGTNVEQVTNATERIVDSVAPMDEEDDDQEQDVLSKLKRLVTFQRPERPTPKNGIQDEQTAPTAPATTNNQQRPTNNAQKGMTPYTPAPAPAPMPQQTPTSVGRLSIQDIVSHVERNSYQIYIGRSLTQQRNPPVLVNIKKKHFKFIGASQKGKSSMAAAFLDIVTRTHDTQHVLVALLDLENSTSKLFASLPHLAEVAINGTPIVLHARNREQVVEYLGYIVQVMEERYTLTKDELEQEPILLVYVEEFLMLKKYFKSRYEAAVKGDVKEQAKKKYMSLVDNITDLAARGLKANVQLVLCAQVTYEDVDFKEALVNVEAGMSFCVRPSAAQAAGFMDYELLKRNALDNVAGQAVAQMADCNDLVLAPDYDLEKRINAYEQAEEKDGPQVAAKRTSEASIKMAARGNLREQRVQHPTRQSAYSPSASMPELPAKQSVNGHLMPSGSIYSSTENLNENTPVYAPVHGSFNGSTGQTEAHAETRHLELPLNEKSTPTSVTSSVEVKEDTSTKSITVNVNETQREMIKRLNETKKETKLTHSDIAKIVKLYGPNYRIYQAVCKEENISTERES